MRLASANQIRKLVHRRLRRDALAAMRAMETLDPRSIERSTVIGISLFAAASIALQGFVVAQGSISGKKSGAAQAAIAPTAVVVFGGAPAGNAVPLKGMVAERSASSRRGDRLNPEIPGILADTGLPRIAGEVPADIVIRKSVAVSASNGIGLREATLAPASLYARDATTSGVILTPRLATADQALPRPTRVALASSASGYAHQLRDAVPQDRGTVIDVAPPVRAPARIKSSSRAGVPADIVQKVHFQDHTPDRCLPTELMNVIYDVAEQFGEVQVLSTFRDPDRNRRVGGAPRSFHLRCQAIDFRVMGRSPGLLKYLEEREDVGGLKRYPLGFYHIDTGPRRTW